MPASVFSIDGDNVADIDRNDDGPFMLFEGSLIAEKDRTDGGRRVGASAPSEVVAECLVVRCGGLKDGTEILMS